MQSTTAKEATTMKSTATHLAVRLAAALAVAVPLAASCGRMYSDQQLKNQIETIPNSTERLRQLTTS
jgi:hypothetical protein